MILQSLCVIVILEFFLALYLFKGDILSPAVIFSAVFLIAVLDLLIMKNYWEVVLVPKTLLIISIGILVFILTSKMMENIHLPKIRLYYGNRKLKTRTASVTDRLYIPKIFIHILIIIYLVLIAGVFATVSGNFSFSSYVIAISNDREELQLPAALSLLFTFCSNSSYLWAYFLSYSIVRDHKVITGYLVLFIESIAIGLATGKRGNAVALVVVFAINLLLMLKRNHSRSISRKVYFLIFIALIVVAFSFQRIATIMGRDSDLFNPIEYFSIYLGAPILNLSTSIARGGFSHPVFLSETFHSLYKSIGSNFGVKSFIYNTDRTFLSSANGLRVGNVDTVFYDFFHDGGFAGVIILTAIMALIITAMYQRIKEDNVSIMRTMIFSYMLWLVARSFFANSFFDWFTLSTIWTLLIWDVSILLFVRNKNEYIREY